MPKTVNGTKYRMWGAEKISALARDLEAGMSHIEAAAKYETSKYHIRYMIETGKTTNPDFSAGKRRALTMKMMAAIDEMADSDVPEEDESHQAP